MAEDHLTPIGRRDACGSYAPDGGDREDPSTGLQRSLEREIVEPLHQGNMQLKPALEKLL